MIVLGADFIVATIFGPEYAPAAMSLRALAPVLPLTYLAMLLSMTLVVLERSWMLTTVSSMGLGINVALTVLFVPLFGKLLGPGGAGVGDALGVVGMELIVSTVLVWNIGRQALDRRLVTNVLKSAVVVGAVSGLHYLLRSIGPVRLIVDGLAYVVLALVMGVPSIGELKELITMVRSRRAQKHAAA
jgi:O-antigen/teichoic acid export membrane protein